MTGERAAVAGESIASAMGQPNGLVLPLGDELSMNHTGIGDPAVSGHTLGHFPDSTMLHRLQSVRSVGLMFGQRALVIGGTDPVNYVGTADHTREPDKERPYRRLVRTAIVFETVFFEPADKADAMLRRVENLHGGVHGEMGESAGPYPAGTEYSAFDPDRMVWTVACMADSALALYEATVGRLTNRERNGLVQDYVKFGELFKMPGDQAPQDYAELREYFDGRLRRGELYLTDAAKFMGTDICANMPFPKRLIPARERMDLIIRGTLREEIRDMYDMPFTADDEKRFKRVTLAVKAGNLILPRAVTHGGNRRFFDWVVNAENRLIANNEAVHMPESAYHV